MRAHFGGPDLAYGSATCHGKPRIGAADVRDEHPAHSTFLTALERIIPAYQRADALGVRFWLAKST